jgi:hypothetical protein
VDWRLYADRSRFQEVPTERIFVLQGAIRRRDGKVWGENWHVFVETSDFDAAWASVPRPGIVVTEREIREDPILRPLFDDWRTGDDSAHRRFMEGVLASQVIALPVPHAGVSDSSRSDTPRALIQGWRRP